MEMNFCRRCGCALTNVENHVYKCENGHIIFANCSPAIGIFFINDSNEILLSVRGIEPHKGRLDAFGGFVDGEETLEATIAREVEEELGLLPHDYSTPEYLTSGVAHYPYGNEVIPALSSLFWARLHADARPKAQDDVAEIFITYLYDVDYDQLHDEDIIAGIKALQARFQ